MIGMPRTRQRTSSAGKTSVKSAKAGLVEGIGEETEVLRLGEL